MSTENGNGTATKTAFANGADESSYHVSLSAAVKAAIDAGRGDEIAEKFLEKNPEAPVLDLDTLLTNNGKAVNLAARYIPSLQEVLRGMGFGFGKKTGFKAHTRRFNEDGLLPDETDDPEALEYFRNGYQPDNRSQGPLNPLLLVQREP